MTSLSGRLSSEKKWKRALRFANIESFLAFPSQRKERYTSFISTILTIEQKCKKLITLHPILGIMTEKLKQGNSKKISSNFLLTTTSIFFGR